MRYKVILFVRVCVVVIICGVNLLMKLLVMWIVLILFVWWEFFIVLLVCVLMCVMCVFSLFVCILNLFCCCIFLLSFVLLIVSVVFVRWFIGVDVLVVRLLMRVVSRWIYSLEKIWLRIFLS